MSTFRMLPHETLACNAKQTIDDDDEIATGLKASTHLRLDLCRRWGRMRRARSDVDGDAAMSHASADLIE